MPFGNITTDNSEFILISFEGPDCYSTAGGLGVRMQNLSRTLAETGFITHLFFIGDPKLPGEESSENGKLILHRWGQWISRYHPGGVYDGEEGKLADFNSSIPGYIVDKIAKPAAARNRMVIILGEEWHTAEVMCRLSDTLYSAGIRGRSILFWNANNTFSFHRINWGRLSYATTITTISRYMKHIMGRMGLTPLVIPNGVPRSLLGKINDQMNTDFRAKMTTDVLLSKIARWDPDKSWMEAVEAIAKLKNMGLKATLLARGGKEPYGQEVINKALSLNLNIKRAEINAQEPQDYLSPLVAALPADIIDIQYQIPLETLATIYRASDAVLANSSHEPFGIVGLEAMAAGGIVFTGSTGEDYSVPFVNSFMIETPDPMEIVSYILYLRNYPDQAKRMRISARYTARNFTWEATVLNLIGKLENQGRIQGIISNNYQTGSLQSQPAEMVAAQRAKQFPDPGIVQEELRKTRCRS